MSWSEIKDWARHVVIPPLVLADRVSVAEAEHLSDHVSIDELVDRNSSWHVPSLRRSADVSYTRNLSIRPNM